MRLFIAINLPSSERERIHRATRTIREAGFPVRWVRPELLHLTLKFLGEVHPEGRHEVEMAMEGIAQSTLPFGMRIRGFGAFPSLRRPRVLWLGVDPSPALRGLNEDVERSLSECGFERETRRFHPHLTLGRSARHANPSAFFRLEGLAGELDYDGEVEVRTIALVESHLSPSGPRYVPLVDLPLAGPQGRVPGPSGS